MMFRPVRWVNIVGPVGHMPAPVFETFLTHFITFFINVY